MKQNTEKQEKTSETQSYFLEINNLYKSLTLLIRKKTHTTNIKKEKNDFIIKSTDFKRALEYYEQLHVCKFNKLIEMDLNNTIETFSRKNRQPG